MLVSVKQKRKSSYPFLSEKTIPNICNFKPKSLCLPPHICGVFYLIRKFLPIFDMQSMMSGGKTVVFFDLETTGFDTPLSQCDIIQVAALSGDRSFNVYTMPGTAIDIEAAEITGLSVQDGALFLHGKAVPTVPLHEALTSFLAFLSSFEQPVLLAAHNAKHFDAPILTRALLRCSLTGQFQQLGSSFLDTLPLSKALYPGLDSYSQFNLSCYFLEKPYNAHNALGDVTALQELYSCWNPNPCYVTQCSF